jgi:thiol-disulfide isomerase/thioredoxin
LCVACSASTGAAPGARDTASATSFPQHVLDFPSVDFDAYESLLYGARGTPVVVNVWASWCEPCRDETPAFIEAANRYGDTIRFLGVDHQDQRDAGIAFFQQYAVPYPSVFNASGDIHDNLGFVGLPDTVFYRADGSIQATWTGPITSSDLEQQLQLLAQSAAS